MSPPSSGAPRPATMSMALNVHGYHPGGSGVDHPRSISTSPSAMTNTLAAHTDQATQAAVRRLIPPTPRCSSLAPSVTTTTLQHNRLPNVTTAGTKSRGEGYSAFVPGAARLTLLQVLIDLLARTSCKALTSSDLPSR